MKLEYTVIVEKDEDGAFCTSVPMLPGCFSHGDSVEDALKRTKEAIELYIEVLREKQESVPVEFESTRITVNAEASAR